jgi:hypothetical protein
MDEYHGIRLDALRIEFIDWTHRAEYIRTRTARKNLPKEFNVEPSWATESATDANAMVALGSGDSIRVVGWSEGANRVLTVTLVAKDLAHGEWWGANAWASNKAEQRGYWAKEE